MSIQLEDLVARLRLDTSGVGTGLSGLNGSLGSVSDKATAAGKKLTLGVTTPLVGIGIASTKLAATFDQTMRQVSIATGGPSDALSDLAKKMGAETAFSANEAADAMLELAKGGMTAAQIEGGALAATMKLAAAGGVDLASASTYVSNSMAAYGLKAKDADKITVALAGAANASSASVESLGMGLSQSAAAARNAGLSLQETTGVLSYFDSVGLKGSDAGTSLKTMLTRLVPATDKAGDAMAALGLDFTKSNGEFVSIADVSEQLRRKLGPLSDEQRTQALQTIFGSDAMRAATALMRGGREEVEKYTKASKDQETTTKLANAAMEGTAGAMERAQGSIETAGLAIGEVLAPYVEKAAGKVEELANRFASASPEVQGMIVKGAALAAVLGPLTLGVGMLAGALSKVIGVAAAVRTALAGTAVAGEAAAVGTSRLGTVAKKAAGIGGMLALADGLTGAAKEGSNLGNVLQSAAGGAGIGAMFGPIGALVGGAGGAGLALLAGSFKETTEEAQAARIELLRSEGLESAKAGADTLAESLVGVSNAYGQVTRAAVESSFTKNGKMDADIAKLRELGVSMSTIVSATMGRADAQRVVDAAITKSLGVQRQEAASARAAYDDVADGLRDVVDQSGQVIKNGESLSSDEVKLYKDAWLKAAGAVKETETNQRTFSSRVEQNTGVLAANRKAVQALADDLGLTNRQYRQLPQKVRTDFEANGLPQTQRDTFRLIGQYAELQDYRSIKSLIEATNAPLTIQQVETLKKRYDLTPKQVKTLVQAVGVTEETAKVANLRREAENTAGTYNVNIHTAYTYSGLKDPTRGRDGRTPAPKVNTQQAQNDGYTYGNDFGDGFVNGLLGKTTASADAGDKLSDAAKERIKARKALMDRIGKLLGDGFADGIAGSRDHVVAQMTKLTDLLEQAGNKAALKVADNAAKALKPLGKQYQNLARDLATAQRDLQAIEDARAVVEARQNAIQAAGGDIGAFDFGNDEEGNPIAVTSERVIGALAAVNNAAIAFDTNLQHLRDAGLSQDALDQLIAKGPEAAGAMAQAILAGGPEAIAQINALQANIASVGLSIQAKSSQTMYDTGVAAQQGLITGLESQMGALEAQMQKIAKAMVKAIRKALRIKSPSRVMMGLGGMTGEGFAVGLDDTTRAVAKAADRVSRAALVDVPQIPTPTFTDPSLGITARAQRAARFAQPSFSPDVRVFIGDRELTDIVDVRIGDTLAPLRTMTRQGDI